MFAYLFIIALLIASASAFAPSQTRYVASSLNMGGMVDELRFKKHYNRFTFKKLAAAIDASGLADELNTGKFFYVYLYHIYCVLYLFIYIIELFIMIKLMMMMMMMTRLR